MERSWSKFKQVKKRGRSRADWVTMGIVSTYVTVGYCVTVLLALISTETLQLCVLGLPSSDWFN